MNLNVPEDTKYRKFTEADQLLHLLGIDMAQAHGLHTGILTIVQTEGKKRSTKGNAAKPRHEDLHITLPHKNNRSMF